MSATASITTAGPAAFLEAARELEETLKQFETLQARATRLVDDISRLAHSDNAGGLPRLGDAVRGEADSLAHYLRDFGGAWDLSLITPAVRDLRALIELAAQPEREVV
jgi:hypothetical protein